MTPNKLNKSLDEAIENNLDELADFSVKGQDSIWKQVKKQMYGLSLTEAGFVKINSKNINLANQIAKKAGKTVSKESLIREIGSYNNGLELMLDLNKKYFVSEFGKIKSDDVFKFTLEAATQNALATIQGDQFSNVVSLAVKDVLVSSLTEKKLFMDLSSDMEKALTGTRNGKQVVHGLVENYWTRNRLTRDALFQQTQSYHEAQASLTDGKWYQYIGNIVDDSRDICIDRLSTKYFHEREIADWSKLTKEQWPEKIPNVDPAIQRGGYNCRHALLLISKRRVPKARQDEVKAKYGDV